MREEMIQRTLNQQSSVAQKVYGAVPIQEPWTVAQIFGELKRNKIAVDYARISGCLNALKKAKIVREPSKGEYIRTAPHTNKPEKEFWQEPVPDFSINVEAKPMADNGERGSREPEEIVAQMTMQMTALVQTMTNLAEEFEVAALELSDYIERNENELKELKEFRRLMKKFGGDV